MAYVCTEITEPIINGASLCQRWEEVDYDFTQSQSTAIPELTNADRDAILLWIVGIFAVVYVVKRIRRMLGS